MIPPITTMHDGILVVRDDLFPGGTKARFIPAMFEGIDELVYASPAEGGAQTAIAGVARDLGKRATIFVAKRALPHRRTAAAKMFGAQVFQVEPGYMTVVAAKARAYCEATGATLAPFGLDTYDANVAIAAAAKAIDFEPEEVWCAAGSGVLARGLAAAWPYARRNVVQVGRPLAPVDVARAMIHVHRLPFARALDALPPFPSDPHYDAKAWEMAIDRRGKGRVLFWNVTGPA